MPRDVSTRAFAACHFVQREHRHKNRKIARSRIEQIEKLHLGIFERGVRHVVDERDAQPVTRVARERAAAQRHAFLLGPPRRNPISCHHHRHANNSLKLKSRKPHNRDLRTNYAFAATPSACSRSARMSSMCSIPTLSRIISGFTPTFTCSSGVSCRCVVEAGWQVSDFESPMFTMRLNNLNASKHLRLDSNPPLTPKVSSDTALSPKYFFAIGYSGLSENPA